MCFTVPLCSYLNQILPSSLLFPSSSQRYQHSSAFLLVGNIKQLSNGHKHWSQTNDPQHFLRHRYLRISRRRFPSFQFCHPCICQDFWRFRGARRRIRVNLRFASGLAAFLTYNLICLIAPYFPKISYISSAVILNGKFLTYRTLLTSGGSRAFAFRPPGTWLADDIPEISQGSLG